tara:strand:+ start:1260 stop:1943 length:684 start_codon:yes stop_codon:yes gene_type:complete
MTLPSSGSLDYNSIRAEFGSPSSNVSLSLYYRGGPYTYAVPANAPITTSPTGQISVSNFYGADGKTDYAAGPFGYHTTGGKIPTVTGGCSNNNTNVPNFSDTSMKVGSVSTSTLTDNVAGNFGFVFGPWPSNAPILNRYINYYNTSGTLTHQWYTYPPNNVVNSWGTPPGNSQGYPNSYRYTTTFGPEPGQPPTADHFTGGSVGTGPSIASASAWNMSGGLLVIKAF